MPLSDKDKSEARDAIALALELNEPESILESLRRLCQRKANETLISAQERDRWHSAHNALDDCLEELKARQAPQNAHEGAQADQDNLKSGC